MKKSVKIRLILFYITAVLSICASIGLGITEILTMCGIIGPLPAKVFLRTSGWLVILAIIQSYPLLKLPTTN